MAGSWSFGSRFLLATASSMSPAFVWLVTAEASVYSVAFPGRVSDQLNCSSSQSFYIAEPSDSYGHTYCMWYHEQGIPRGCVSIHTCHRFSWEVCSPDSFTLSLLRQLRTLETALGSKINKLQQFFDTLSVSQEFSLFLDLTYSSNVLSITCILCKTVTSASRILVIT